VKLLGAAEERGGIELRELHREDLMPIRTVRVCTKEGKEVPLRDIVKGFEYREGAYVVVDRHDLEQASLKTTKTIDIHEFAESASVDPLYCGMPYFLVPDAGGEEAYALLCDALGNTGKIGITTFMLRGRERLGYVQARGDVLVLQRMRFLEEVRDPATVAIPPANVRHEELHIAETLIEYLTQPFRMEEYRDTHTEELQRVIQDKVRGVRRRRGTVKEPRVRGTQDLKDLLRQSVDNVRAVDSPGQPHRGSERKGGLRRR
jgi:DNA end-binding protein Ku